MISTWLRDEEADASLPNREGLAALSCGYGGWLGEVGGGSPVDLWDWVGVVPPPQAASVTRTIPTKWTLQQALGVPALLPKPYQFGCCVGRLSQICQKVIDFTNHGVLP